MANNLYYRLTTKGYSAFFDLEEMRRDNFDKQLLTYIENAKDIFVILENGSLDGCKKDDWENDWFCREIAHALKYNKNIIPILLYDYQMPKAEDLPDELKELTMKNAPEFSFSYFDTYLDKLEEKGYITSGAIVKNKVTSIFKFYSNEKCKILKDGKLVGYLDGESMEPYYLPVSRKGDYRFRCEKENDGDVKLFKEHIDADEEREVEIIWSKDKVSEPDSTKVNNEAGGLDSKVNPPLKVSGECFDLKIDNECLTMIRVEGGKMTLGATAEQIGDAEDNEYPAHEVEVPTFYIGQFPITQNIWEAVMGYNKSYFRQFSKRSEFIKAGLDTALMVSGPIVRAGYDVLSKLVGSKRKDYPAETLSYDEAQEFVRRLSGLTNIEFALPTEDEWEYAARGGRFSKGYKYAGSDDLNEVAWYRDNSDGTTHPVGQKLPNELGLYDMCGNVWEWTETPAHSYNVKVKPEGSCFIRRGGSWWHKSKNCRVSHRYPSDRTKKTKGLGLRVIIRNFV